MTQTADFLKDKHILAVDDEIDILETIQEILIDTKVDIAKDYDTASKKIMATQYDLAILDIMGVNGIQLLEECVAKKIPAIMLTANSMNPKSLVESIQKGAISYLSKEHLSEIDSLINALLGAKEEGKHTWKLLFDKLGGYFDKRFGQNWKDDDREFWEKFDKTHYI